MTGADVAPALRSLSRRPGLSIARLATVVVVVTAVATVAAMASATLLRPLPFPDAERLVQIYSLSDDTTDVTQSTALFPVEFEHLAERGPSIEAIAAIWPVDRAITGRGEPDSVTGGRVTANFFELLGASFSIGRPINEDEVDENAPVIVLSHGLWVRMFGSNPDIVGAVVQVDRQPHTVIGVTAASFEPAFTRTQFWTPLKFRDVTTLRASVVQTIGRLRTGATAAAATTDLAAVTTAARQHMPDLVRGTTLGALDLRESRYGSRRNALLMLAVMVSALGLLAVANLANLTIADLASRMSDFALRSALGGSAAAIASTELIPCLILAAFGATIGIWIAATAVPVVLALDPSLAASGVQITIDWRVVIAGVTASFAIMGLAVMAPSWRVARRDQLTFFNSTRTTDSRGGRLRGWLVTAQTAMALVLVSASALVVAAVWRNASRHPGFEAANVVTGQLRLAENVFPDHASRVRFVRSVLERLRSTPGIVGAGTTLNLFTVGSSFTTNVSIEEAPRADGQPYVTEYRRVSPGYFDAMRIRVRRGRDFLDTDNDNTPLVAVINESFARRYWATGDPIGKRIKRGAATTPWAEIVGIVDDVRDAGLTRETGPTLYTSYYQGSTAATPAALVVRTASDPRSVLPQVKQAVWSVDPAQPLSSVVVLDDYLRASLGPQQFRAWLVALCALFGLMLAVIGIYGVTARTVAERTREVGIRVALGGHPAAVWWRIVTASLRAVFAGATVGAALSVAVDAGMVRLLPELGSGDWIYRVAAALMIIVVGGAAAMIAARRAALIEPVQALRGD